MLIPVIFFVIFSCVWFCLHLHNSALLTFGCGRSAVCGRELANEELHFYLTETASLELNGGAQSRSASGKVKTVWFADTEDRFRSTEETLTYDIVKPVQLIRRAHAVIELTEGE